MYRLHLGFLSVLLILADSTRGDTDWFDCGTDHSCKIFSEKKIWHDAEAACNAAFGHLASIVSQTNDRDKITLAARGLWPAITDYWIGLNHLGGINDQWRFTDGESVNMVMWAKGYPETADPYGLIEMCGVEWAGGFHNEHCDKKNQYVCKKLRGATTPVLPTTTTKPPADSYCPKGYTAIDPTGEPNMGEKCFKFVFLDNKEGVTWDEAVKLCRDSGRKSDIASIHGPYEHEFIRSQMVDRTFGLWVGLRRTSEGLGWEWLDNSAFKEEDTNWNEGQPSNGWNENCVEVLSIPHTAKWNDLTCDQPRGYICQTYKDPGSPIHEAPPPPQQNCLDDYIPYQYGCYRLLSTTEKSWEEMRDECRNHGKASGVKSDLASIHSDAEDATLHIKIMQSGKQAWIGFKEYANNTFEWSNGWYPTYANWGSDEGGNRTYEGCVVMDNGPNGGWYEVDCTTPLAGICKHTDDEPTKAPTVKNGSCPGEMYGATDWLKYESYCYLPVSQAMSWHDARLHCANFGPSATLVSIHSDNENQFVHDNMPTPSWYDEAGWIGLYSSSKDDGFHWTDGSPFQYEKWNLGEPSSNGEDDEDCVRMYIKQHDGSYWDDNHCGNYNPFMCKVDQGPPVEPPPEHPGTCPDGWYKFGAFCYLVFPDYLRWWYEAEESCQKEGGNLPQITSYFQQEFISNKLRESSGFNKHSPYWIGLHQERGEYMYQWASTGEEYDHRGFHMFEEENGVIKPDIAMGRCVDVEHDTDNDVDVWKTGPCEVAAAYVCEMSLDESTKPPSNKNGSCPGELYGATSWLKYESYCYLPVSQSMSWHNARLHCAKLASSATLVSIHSNEENKFVRDNMPKPRLWSKAGWIGLYHHVKDGEFHWTDGSTVQYEKWNLGEPNSNGEDNKDCVRIDIKGHDESYWDDDHCDNGNPFMCKVEQGPPVEPPPEYPGTCPDGWHKFGAFCYLVFPDTLMWWHEAEESCQKEGGDLPTITSYFQAEFITDMMRESSGFDTPDPYWIGLHQERGEVPYQWAGTGEEYDPRGFYGFENQNGVIEPDMAMGRCVDVEYDTDNGWGLWKTVPCDGPAAYVCEKPLDTDG